MSNKLKVIYSQKSTQLLNGTNKEIQFDEQTELGLNKTHLKRWASELLFDLLKFFQVIENHTFDLRKPIYADVYFNGKLELELVQTVIRHDSRIREGFDFPYVLKKRKYMLSPKKFYSPIKKNSPVEKKVETVNLQRLLNSIEYSTRAKIKYATPILYTGMTQ